VDKNFMNQTVQPLQDYINGEFSSPSVHRGIWLENPNTRERLQEQLATDDANIGKALASAQDAFESGVWSEMSVDERCGYLAELSNFTA
jgi:acyl-CoA reductase-like NAD-dependent aldehyde dehydrogenase